MIYGASPGPVVQVTNNRIFFTVATGGYGFYIYSVSGGQVEHNAVLGQSKSWGVGLNIQNSTSVLVSDNATKNLNYGLFASGDSGLSIRANNFSSNGYGMEVASSSYVDVEDNVTASNTTYGIYFDSGSASYIYRNNVSQGNGTNYSGGTSGGGNY